MNPREEQRVIEALQAITGGLIVTEHDILTASGRLRSNLEPPSPRRRMTVVAMAAAAAVLVAGYVAFQVLDSDEDAAPAKPTQSAAEKLQDSLGVSNAIMGSDAEFVTGRAPTAQDLTGLWLMRAPDDAPMGIDGDGDWAVGQLEGDPGIHGTSTLTGRTWTRHVAGDWCTDDFEQAWTASIATDGSLHLLIPGAPVNCTPGGNREVWNKLTPGPSPMLEFFKDASAEMDWTTPTDWSWAGMYINPETGHVLDVEGDGSYSYYDSATGKEFAPSDQGKLDVDAAPGTISGSCGNGSFAASFEVGKTPGVTDYALPYDALRIVKSAEACTSGLGTEGMWVNLTGDRSGE